MGRPKMLIVGWDGATFDIIGPLVNQGRLPNIASIMQDGAWGKLESTIPHLTPVAWTSMSTGVNPGKHGIYDGIVYMPEEHKICFVNATMRKVRPIWSILSDCGSKVGVLNVPLTYPPDEVSGFMIPGMFTPNGLEDFIYPPELQTEIEKKFGKYMIECRQEDNPSTYLKLILEMINFREKIALYLMDRYPLDFLFLVFIASDRVQHFFWKYLDPIHPEHNKYGDAIALIYERLDQVLGRLLERIGPDTNVVIVSDHGSGPLHSALFLNNWLMRKGYLHLKEDPAIFLKLKKKSRIRSVIVKSIKKLLPSNIWDRLRIYDVDQQKRGFNLFCTLIDWDKTVAFSEGVGGGIYVNPDTIKPERYQVILEQLIQGLYDIKDGQGKKVVKAVYKRDELYHGDQVEKIPDLIVMCSEGYQIIAPNEVLYLNKEYEDTMFLSHRWSGRHEQHGIFLLKGPAIKKNMEIFGARIIDVAPTVLYLMYEAIPEYMDGKVLDEAIEKEYITRNPVCHETYVVQQESTGMKLSEEEEKDIAEKLKGLGYIE